MARKPEVTVLLENAKIIFRNFAGTEKQYNRKGDRNFAVVVTPEQAEDLMANGWKVKQSKDREVDEEVVHGDYYLPVAVKWGKGRPPEIWTIGSKNRTKIDEESVEELDYVEILSADMTLRQYEWEVSGNTGNKTYLKQLFVTVVEDYLTEKYAHLGQTP